MRDIDAKMRLRPPQGHPQAPHQNGGPPCPPGVNPALQFQRSLSTPSPNYDVQTALRVRRWIESKTVTNVADCRPYLNQEIQQGFNLRKTTSMNDRSAPRF